MLRRVLLLLPTMVVVQRGAHRPLTHGGGTTRRIHASLCMWVGYNEAHTCLPGMVKTEEDLCAQCLSLLYYRGCYPMAIRSFIRSCWN